MTDQIWPATDVNTWHFKIEIQDQVDENDLFAMCPWPITDVESGELSTRFAVQADQSGLIGMIRHLHNRGISLISINRES